MSTSRELARAISDVVRLRNHLRSAREYARPLGLEEQVRQRIESLSALEADLKALRTTAGKAEVDRAINLKKHRGAA